MIKTILISFFFLVTSFINNEQDPVVIDIVYEGVDDGIYYFSEDQDFNTYAFNYIAEAASKKYDLSDKKFIGSRFRVTYETEQFMDEDNEPYEELTIKDILKIEKEQ